VGLREQAAADLRAILEDSAAGFGWPIKVTDPSGKVADVVGNSGDVSQVIDPQTGMAITGRVAHVAIAIATLRAAGFTDLPRGIADEKRKPWLVTFNDIGGTAHTFKVIEALPDQTIGLMTCTLEAYEV
jgi:hypothetical protein